MNQRITQLASLVPVNVSSRGMVGRGVHGWRAALIALLNHRIEQSGTHTIPADWLDQGQIKSWFMSAATPEAIVKLFVSLFPVDDVTVIFDDRSIVDPTRYVASVIRIARPSGKPGRYTLDERGGEWVPTMTRPAAVSAGGQTVRVGGWIAVYRFLRDALMSERSDLFPKTWLQEDDVPRPNSIDEVVCERACTLLSLLERSSVLLADGREIAIENAPAADSVETPTTAAIFADVAATLRQAGREDLVKWLTKVLPRNALR